MARSYSYSTSKLSKLVLILLFAIYYVACIWLLTHYLPAGNTTSELGGRELVARRRRRDGGGAVAALNGHFTFCPCTLAAILA